MKNNLIITVMLILPITIIGLGLYNNSLDNIKSGVFLLLFLWPAFVGASIKEYKKINISSKTKKKMFFSFALAIAIIMSSFFLDHLIIGCFIAGCLGLYMLFIIGKENKLNEKE